MKRMCIAQFIWVQTVFKKLELTTMKMFDLITLLTLILMINFNFKLLLNDKI